MSPDPRRVFADLAAEHLADPEVAPGRMLHAEAVTVHGNTFAFVTGTRLVVKLPAARVDELVAAGRGERFGPGERVMREWAGVPVDGDGDEGWRGLMAEARAYVATLPPKTPRAKRR
jgi:hypothetical protein